MSTLREDSEACGMSSTVWVGVLVGVIVFFIKACWTRHRSFLPLPFVGHLPHFALLSRQHLLQWIARGFEQTRGKSWRISVPLIGEGWMIEDPSCLKHVLSTRHDAFGKGELATSRLKDLFGDGIILVSGQPWRSQRLAGHHAFTRPPNLNRFVNEVLPRHLDLLLRPLATASASPGTTVDIQEIAYSYAMAVFGELAYDTDFNAAELGGGFVGAFDRAAIVSEGRFTNPAYRWTERFLPYGKRFRRDVRDVKEFGRSLVRQRRTRFEFEAEGSQQEEERAMIGRGQPGESTLLTELVQQFGREEDDAFLADSCLNFLTAGRDTTAQALSWTVYLLLSHPSHLPVLLSEFGKQGPTSSYIELTSPTGPFPYLNAVISESLRLHPPVPLEIQENISEAAAVLPDGSIVLPGEKVLWSPWQMGRSTRIWGIHAAEFRPERWLHPQAQGEQHPGTKHPLDMSAYENPVFHAGPRSCLGKGLARAELAYALKALLTNYELLAGWDLAKGKKVAAGLTGPVAEGLFVSVTRRAFNT